jgi:hypothetical protein
MGDILWCSFMGFSWILMEKKNLRDKITNEEKKKKY